ncbi:8-amino-7-oxononanoate synthase [Capnocytophaga sp. oral taxon 326]|jgi:8-amino-7-oxononanoate synthase|uniref:aminotransferase class I/II-fold pyridoxal phosphate-dependent enzyme n=1 Tax=Capnocytophaga sp. oral taxon 326 TaxID=712212 RepID=UPI0002A1D1FB|nr:8-amino-7-oxononanoate synthase [Capnocytophaga sp. oral taxon 326]EKY14251.1 putative 8-amino-7-oxononanoate synthase [Capnocytophaga sp. oral taxon 326 str. F0382]
MKHIREKLTERQKNNALRKLSERSFAIDFYSNDYIGFSTNPTITERVSQLISDTTPHGATGSRLLSGNSHLFTETERYIADFHNAEGALLYNSGYDANVGFFSCIVGRGDVILYDSYSHASIRDGISLSLAHSYKFKHNDLDDLEKLLKKFATGDKTVLIATESVFSMDGDSPDLVHLVALAQQYGAYIAVDEAHAIGVFGKHGCGLVQALGLETAIFARIVTFGKGLGAHGAAVVANDEVIQYLVNFSRSFIYTTAMSPHSVATIRAGYEQLQQTEAMNVLHHNIEYFKSLINQYGIEGFIPSDSAIQAMVVSGNDRVKSLAERLQTQGIGVLPILAPTVPAGQERLRVCLHSFNTEKEIKQLVNLTIQQFSN